MRALIFCFSVPSALGFATLFDLAVDRPIVWSINIGVSVVSALCVTAFLGEGGRR